MRRGPTWQTSRRGSRVPWKSPGGFDRGPESMVGFFGGEEAQKDDISWRWIDNLCLIYFDIMIYVRCLSSRYDMPMNSLEIDLPVDDLEMPNSQLVIR